MDFRWQRAVAMGAAGMLFFGASASGLTEMGTLVALLARQAFQKHPGTSRIFPAP